MPGAPGIVPGAPGTVPSAHGVVPGTVGAVPDALGRAWRSRDRAQMNRQNLQNVDGIVILDTSSACPPPPPPPMCYCVVPISCLCRTLPSKAELWGISWPAIVDSMSYYVAICRTLLMYPLQPLKRAVLPEKQRNIFCRASYLGLECSRISTPSKLLSKHSPCTAP